MKLGASYEAIIEKLIKREYAGNRTEAIRQALVAYDHMLEEEEAYLVRQKVEEMMEEIESGRPGSVAFNAPNPAIREGP
ncbi:hypothetical protein [Methanocella conradii]|uniref:hypothetical protein n=1 Tax=Methanocella conradii TaxID=1175444 RepID=UPI0024B3784A|nr:hypothetical protein [Methanocella conradii]MDI6897277.1 hypothetical protein [Methanocella conradii]